MTFRWIRWSLLIAVTSSIIAVASCALYFGGSAPTIPGGEYNKGDAYMVSQGFEVVLDAATPPHPRPFDRIPRLYVKGKGHGPRVIVLHELPGLRDGDIDVA